MKPSEAAEIITILTEYYPGWIVNRSVEEKTRIITAWAAELVDLGSFEDVSRAVHECLRENPGAWPPGIFEIRASVIPRVRSIQRHTAPLLERPVVTKEELEKKAKTAEAWTGKALGLISKVVSSKPTIEPATKKVNEETWPDDPERKRLEVDTSKINEAELMRLTEKYGKEKVKEIFGV